MCALLCAPLVVLSQQTCKPITKDGLIRSFEPGRRQRKLAADYVELINRCSVGFSLTREDEQRIRRAGSYLGKKGLDDLITAVRKNYRAIAQPNPPPPSPSDEQPLSVLNDIPFKAGPPQRLDTLMSAAGYTGPTPVVVLFIKNTDQSQGIIYIGTRPEMNAKTSWRLEPDTWMTFGGGENSTRLYIQSAYDGMMNVTYRPKSVLPAARSMPTEDDESGEERIVFFKIQSSLEPINLGTKVVITNEKTGTGYSATTVSLGDYSIANTRLPPGTYTASITYKGASGQIRFTVEKKGSNLFQINLK
jgi:hypothetical protein